MDTHNTFYCNIQALNPKERAQLAKLRAKLMAARKQTSETEAGYEFQFSAAEISLRELAEFVEAESKCCAFFDFGIEVQQEGSLLTLRLSGAEGAKAFMQAEFHLD